MPYPSTRSAFETYKRGETTREIKLLVSMVLLVRGFRGKLDEELRKIGQSTARMETLAAILNMPGDKSQSEVARRLRIEGATVTRMVDILSKEGLVCRSPDPNDRRVNLLSLTQEGETKLREIFRTYDGFRRHLLDDVSPEEQEIMFRLVQKMLTRLDLPIEKEVHIEDLPKFDRLRDTIARSSPDSLYRQDGDREEE